MEQNSFLFQQSSRIGFSHQDFFRYVVNNAFERREINKHIEDVLSIKNRKPLPVLFGGDTAEKQTSLMSGTNVWLKLRGSKIYKPFPYLLGKDKEVWELPYSYILNHTVEEIIENAKNGEQDASRLSFLVEKVKLKLGLRASDITEGFFIPQKMHLDDLIKRLADIFYESHQK